MLCLIIYILCIKQYIKHYTIILYILIYHLIFLHGRTSQNKKKSHRPDAWHAAWKRVPSPVPGPILMATKYVNSYSRWWFERYWFLSDCMGHPTWRARKVSIWQSTSYHSAWPGGGSPWRVFHSIAAIFHGCFRCKSLKMMISWLSQYHLIKKFVLRVLAVDAVLYYRGFAGIPCLLGEVRQGLVWLFFVSTASRPTVHVLLMLMDKILQLRQWTSFLTMDDVIASISTDTNLT